MANKEKKKISKSLIITLIVIVIAAALIIVYQKDKSIGGERDEYGCLSAAGFSYDSEVGACIRSWEITEDDDKKAAKIAVDSVGESGLTIIEVTEAKCDGCFLVKLEKDSSVNDIILYSWKARTKELSAEECFALGAKLVKESEGCPEETKNFGSVISFDYPKICCVA